MNEVPDKPFPNKLKPGAMVDVTIRAQVGTVPVEEDETSNDARVLSGDQWLVWLVLDNGMAGMFPANVVKRVVKKGK